MFLRAEAFRAKAFAARFLGGVVGAAPEPEAEEVSPVGGWERLQHVFRRPQTEEEKRKERERLGIIPREQRKIERAAKAIAKRIAERPSVDIEAEILRASEFNKLMADISARNKEIIGGLSLFLVQAIQARILEELRDEDDAIAMLLLEM